MVNRKDLMSLGFYKLSPYTGNDGNMRYRIEKNDDMTKLVCEVWRGPLAYDTTSEEKIRHEEEFSDSGLNATVEWLNQMSPSFNKSV